MSYLIDTNIIIDYLRKTDYAIELMNKIKLEETPYLSSVTTAELLAGCSPKKRKTLCEFINKFNIIEINNEIAIQTGILVFDFARKGITLHFQDATLAATALAHNFTLITKNKKHFPMKEVQLFDI